MRKLFAAVAVFAVASSVALVARARQKTQTDFDGKTWWDYVKVLADDNMEGRETGSAGLKRARSLYRRTVKADGVEPAGNDGYYQPVKFEVRQIVEKDSSIALIRDGKSEPLALGEDAYFNTRVDLAPEIEAPLVFVGYGLTIPEKSYDDLAGLDLKGKVAVIFGGVARRDARGARVALSVRRRTLEVVAKSGRDWRSHAAKSRLDGYTMVAHVAESRASQHGVGGREPERNRRREALHDRESGECGKILRWFRPHLCRNRRVGKDRKPLPRFPLAVSIKAVTKVEKTEVESANVIGKLPGSDPALKNEYVVISAHIDHLGNRRAHQRRQNL